MGRVPAAPAVVRVSPWTVLGQEADGLGPVENSIPAPLGGRLVFKALEPQARSGVHQSGGHDARRRALADANAKRA